MRHGKEQLVSAAEASLTEQITRYRTGEINYGELLRWFNLYKDLVGDQPPPEIPAVPDLSKPASIVTAILDQKPDGSFLYPDLSSLANSLPGNSSANLQQIIAIRDRFVQSLAAEVNSRKRAPRSIGELLKQIEKRNQIHPDWVPVFSKISQFLPGLTVDDFIGLLLRGSSQTHTEATREVLSKPTLSLQTEFIARGLFITDTMTTTVGLINLVGGVSNFNSMLAKIGIVKIDLLDPETSDAQKKIIPDLNKNHQTPFEICQFLAEFFIQERYRMVHLDRALPSPTTSPIKGSVHNPIIIDRLIRPFSHEPFSLELPTTNFACRLISEISNQIPARKRRELEKILFPAQTIDYDPITSSWSITY